MELLIERLKKHITEEKAKDISSLQANEKKEAEYNISCIEKFLKIQEDLLVKKG